MAAVDARYFGKCTDTLTAIGTQVPKSEPGKNAILLMQGHKVGNGTHSDQIEVILELDALRPRIFGLAAVLEQSMEQLKNEARGAEVTPGGSFGVIHVWVDKDTVDRCLRLRLVVVDDDDIDPHFAQIGDRLVRIGSAVQCDKERRNLAVEDAINRFAAEAIAFVHTPWHAVTWL